MENVVTLRPEQPAKVKYPYVAYGLGMATKEGLRVSVHRHGGTVFQLENAVMTHALRLDEEAVGFVFSNCIIEIVGQNLDALPKLMEYYHPTFIEVFNPDFYLMPPEDAPFIAGLRWKTVLEADGQVLLPNFQSDTSLIIFD